MKKLFLILLLLLSTVVVSYSQTWTKQNLPLTCNFNDLVVSYSNPNIIYGVGPDGTYKSIDNGGSWSKVSSSSCNIIAVSKKDPNYVFTDLESSDDGGQSWSLNSSPLTNIFQLEFQYGSNSNILMHSYDISSTAYVLKKSTDFGTTWSILKTPDRTLGEFELIPATPNLIIAKSTSSIFKSTDFGNSWTEPKNNALDWNGTSSHNLAVDPSNPNNIYVTRYKYNGWTDSLLISTNGGLSYSHYAFNSSIKYVISLEVDPSNSAILYLTENDTNYNPTMRLYKSTDYGHNWNPQSLMTGKGLSKIELTKNGILWHAECGIKSTDKGVTGNSSGYKYPRFYSWETFPIIDGNNFYASGNGVIFRSTNSGKDWQPIHTTGGGVCAIDKSTNKIFLFDGFNIFTSSDEGKSWIKIFFPLNTYYSASNFYVDKTNENNIFINKSYSLIRTTNGGLSWSSINTPTTVDKFFYSPSTPNYVFYISNDYNNSRLYKSTNLGTSWTLANINYGVSDYAEFLGFGPNNTLYLYGNSIFVSSDNGGSWIKRKDGSDLSIDNIAVSPKTPNKLYGNYLSGIKGSSDGGITWLEVPLPSEIEYIDDFRVGQNDSLYLLTTTGMYIGDALLTAVKYGNSIITNYELKQNHPNPFNPSTVIKYALPFESKVILNIYNTLGQEVALLKDEITSMGNYEVQFNSSNLPSGAYFYRLSAESLDGKQKYSSIKKMILLK